jgi:uncharacterized protein YneR
MQQSPIPNPSDDEKAYARTVGLAILGFGLLVCLGGSALGFLRYQAQLVAIYGNYFPTPTSTSTPTATLTATPTSTPTNTFTPTPNLTATQSAFRTTGTALAFQSTATGVADQWKKIFSESFDNNNQYWYVQTLDTEYLKIAFDVKDGKYRWNATAHKGFIQEMPLPRGSVSDLFVTVEVNLSDHTGSSDYGITFRKDLDGNLYYFAIDSDGMYSLFKYYGGGWSALIDRTRSSAINKNQPNELALIMEGDHIILFINNQFISEKRDDSIKKGITSLAMELFEPDQQAVVEFDNVVLRVPK